MNVVGRTTLEWLKPLHQCRGESTPAVAYLEATPGTHARLVWSLQYSFPVTTVAPEPAEGREKRSHTIEQSPVHAV